MNLLDLENTALWAALCCYTVATVAAIFGFVFQNARERFLLATMTLGWMLHTLAIGLRWDRLGHLPFINMFEVLSANIWGLMLALLIAYWRKPALRGIAALLLPIILMLTAWMLMVPRQDSQLPYTFHTLWLYIHIGFIKIFLGAAFVALGIAAVILLRKANLFQTRLARLPDDNALDVTAHRCMALALIFDTLGVAAGAIWAQDAWGRYWQWDPLEVWSLITWLSIAMMIHVRASFRPLPYTNALLIGLVFVVAFLTFFGIPFVSEAFHQGTFSKSAQ